MDSMERLGSGAYLKSYSLDKLNAAREAVNQGDKDTALRLIDELIERHKSLMETNPFYRQAYELQHPKKQDDGRNRSTDSNS